MLEGTERLSYCNCWVRKLSEEKAFGVRFGAHNPICPAYQRSRDPIDDANDVELRQRMQGIALSDDQAERYDQELREQGTKSLAEIKEKYNIT